jgi:abnormal spindle-like microcephaly-associated protein
VDFKVASLAQDLRDGVILARLAEVLSSGRCNVQSALRYPADTAQRKTHNVSKALAALVSLGCNPRVAPKDIVTGHRERTLSMLWNLMVFFTLDSAFDIAQLRAEIATLRARRVSPVPDERRLSGEQVYANSERLSTLLNWAHEVCQGYGVAVHNFTSSFSDGTAFLLLVHHYIPSVVPFRTIKTETTHADERRISERAIGAVENGHGWAGAFSPGNNRAGGR